MRSLNSVVFLAALVAASLSTSLARSTPTLGNIALGQVSWKDGSGTTQVTNSLYGTMTMTVAPDPSATFYLNVVASYPANAATDVWIVQNMPILSTARKEDTFQSVDFDLTDLNFTAGQSASSVFDLTYFLTATAQSAPPASGGTTLTNVVASAVTQTLDGVKGADPGSAGVAFVNIGRPGAHKAAGAATNVIQHDNVPAVQEGRSQCLPGSFARSIKWLYSGEAINATTTAQQIFADLVGLKIGSKGAGATTYEQDIVAKANYLNNKVVLLNLAGVTAIDIVSAGRVGATTGVPQETTDLVTWLNRVLPTDDVELDYFSHIVTITGSYVQNGVTYVKYRDDEAQGDDTTGDAAVKRAKLTLSGGNYYFRQQPGGNDFKVALGISEALTVNNIRSAPALRVEHVVILAALLSLLGVAALRVRWRTA